MDSAEWFRLPSSLPRKTVCPSFFILLSVLYPSYLTFLSFSSPVHINLMCLITYRQLTRKRLFEMVCPSDRRLIRLSCGPSVMPWPRSVFSKGGESVCFVETKEILNFRFVFNYRLIGAFYDGRRVLTAERLVRRGPTKIYQIAKTSKTPCWNLDNAGRGKDSRYVINRCPMIHCEYTHYP